MYSWKNPSRKHPSCSAAASRTIPGRAAEEVAHPRVSSAGDKGHKKGRNRDEMQTWQRGNRFPLPLRKALRLCLLRERMRWGSVRIGNRNSQRGLLPSAEGRRTKRGARWLRIIQVDVESNVPVLGIWLHSPARCLRCAQLCSPQPAHPQAGRALRFEDI